MRDGIKKLFRWYKSQIYFKNIIIIISDDKKIRSETNPFIPNWKILEFEKDEKNFDKAKLVSSLLFMFFSLFAFFFTKKVF